MKGIWKKWETYARLGKSRGESQVERHFVGFPGEKYGTIILEVLEMPGTPQKQKWAAATITKQTQKLAKKIKTSDNQLFSFSHLFPLRPQPPN